MKLLYALAALAVLAPSLLFGAVPTTFITGSLNLPSGAAPSNVTIKLTPSTQFNVTDAAGLTYHVLAPVTYSITNTSNLAMYVVPNTGKNNVPDFTTYAAEITAGRTVIRETWQIASSTVPVTVANVVVNSTVNTTPTSALPLAGGTMLGKIQLVGSGQPGLNWPPTTEPASAVEGDTYINSVDGKMYIRFGGAWVASASGLLSVIHTAEFVGSGTSASPLQLATNGVTGGAIASVPDSLQNVTSNTSITISGNGTGGVSFGTERVDIRSGPVGGDADGDILVRGQHVTGRYSPVPIGTEGQALRPTSVAGKLAYSSIFATTNTVTFSSANTYTAPSGLVGAIVECIGNGGGGGGSDGAAGYALAAAGGGAGGYSRRYLTAAQIGASKSITFGATGSGAGAGSGTGTTGGDVSFGGLVVAKGGSGGSGVNTGIVPTGGNGGGIGTGDFTCSGARGDPGVNASIATVIFSGGTGGSSMFGSGGRGGAAGGGAVEAGQAASGYGSGGGGGATVNTASDAGGGTGSTGICIITEFKTK